MDPPPVGVLNIVQPLFGSLSVFDPASISLSGWVELFEEYCMANAVTEKPAEVNNIVAHNQRRAIFLSHVGPRAYEVLRKTCLPARANSKSIPELIAILRAKYEPPGLVASNRYTFGYRTQRESESIQEYIAALQQLASNCDFGQFLPHALRDRLIAGTKYPDIRSKLLGITDLTWDQAKEVALQVESIKLQSKVLGQSADFHQVNSNKKFRPKNSKSTSPGFRPKKADKPVHQSSSGNSQPQRKFNPCHRCGECHDVRTCPAINWTCRKCSKKGHAARVCRSSAVHAVHDSKSSEEVSVEQEAMQLLDFNRVQVIPDPMVVQDTVFLSEVPRPVEIIECDSSEVPRPVEIIECDSSEVPQPVAIMGRDSVECVMSDGCMQSIYHNYASMSAKNPSKPTREDSVVDANLDYGSRDHARICADVNVVCCYNQIADSPPLYFVMNVESQFIKMEIDNGSGTSLMALPDYLRFFPGKPLAPSHTILRAVSGDISNAGERLVQVTYQGKQFDLPLIVCKDTSSFTPLLGRAWLDVLLPDWRTYLSLNDQLIHSLSNQPTVDQLKEWFPNPFATNTDSAIVGFEANLTLKKGAVPIFSRAYPVPYGLVDKVNAHLDKLESTGKIVPVHQSDWASPAVIVAKPNNEIRYCVDFKKTVRGH